MGKEMGGRFKRKGIYVYLWLIHVEVWQKTIKFYKETILQKISLKMVFKEKKTQEQGKTGYVSSTEHWRREGDKPGKVGGASLSISTW